MPTSVTVDEVGHLVLPKKIREAIGIFGRTAVNVEVVGDAVRITAREQATGVVARKRGRLVWTGSLPENWDSGEEVQQMRLRRIRR